MPVTLWERRLRSELTNGRIRWLGSVAALEIAVALGLFSGLGDVETAEAHRLFDPRWISVGLAGLFLLTGAALLFCIAVFQKSAATARALMEIDPTLTHCSIHDGRFFTGAQTEALEPPRYAILANRGLMLLTLANAVVLIWLAHLIAYADRTPSDPRINVTVELPERAPPPPAQPPAQPSVTVAPPEVNVAVEVQRDDRVILSRFEAVFFATKETDGPEVRSQVERIAERIADWRRGWPCTIRVWGHADSRGDDLTNAKLSNARVETAARLLEALVDDAAVLRGKAAGERRQLEVTGDGVDEWINRRVDVAVECRE